MELQRGRRVVKPISPACRPINKPLQPPSKSFPSSVRLLALTSEVIHHRQLDRPQHSHTTRRPRPHLQSTNLNIALLEKMGLLRHASRLAHGSR